MLNVDASLFGIRHVWLFLKICATKVTFVVNYKFYLRLNIFFRQCYVCVTEHLHNTAYLM